MIFTLPTNKVYFVIFKAKMVWPHISRIKTLRKLRGENHKFRFSLDYIAIMSIQKHKATKQYSCHVTYQGGSKFPLVYLNP